ncbi:MAG: hypothetical protein WD207_05350 [Xanthobacteraceae bacterium]
MPVFRPIAVALTMALLAGGCVISKEPVFGPETRVVPFASGTRFQIFQRETAKGPWKLDDKEIVLVASADKLVREVGASGKPDDDESYTFHSLGPNRYLAQGDFGDGRYAYGVLEVRGGEGLVAAFQCKSIDTALLQRAGVKVTADDCVLDGVPDRAGFLKQLAARPTEPLIKYVPVKKK